MCSLGQFLCSRIGGSKRAISDRRPDRVFLRSRKSAFSIPIVAIEQSDPHIPSRKSTFSTGCVDRNCSIEKIGIEKALFRLRKNTRSGLRSEIALFDPPIRLHRNWPNEHTGTLNHENSRIRGQATAGQLEAATLSVRVLYKSASTVPRCIPLVFPSTRSNSATLLPSKLTRQPKKINEMPNSLCNKKTQIIARRFVVLL